MSAILFKIQKFFLNLQKNQTCIIMDDQFNNLKDKTQDFLQALFVTMENVGQRNNQILLDFLAQSLQQKQQTNEILSQINKNLKVLNDKLDGLNVALLSQKQDHLINNETLPIQIISDNSTVKPLDNTDIEQQSIIKPLDQVAQQGINIDQLQLNSNLIKNTIDQPSSLLSTSQTKPNDITLQDSQPKAMVSSTSNLDKEIERSSLQQPIINTPDRSSDDNIDIKDLSNQNNISAENNRQTLFATETKQINEQVQAQKKTSSVLDFLHNRVIKDDSKTLDNCKPQSTNNTNAQELINQSLHNVEDDQPSLRIANVNNNQPKPLYEQFECKAKQDLKQIIGVSEKFLFINDLFSGSVREYTDFINMLSERKTLQESLDFVSFYQSSRKWPKGSLAYTTLEGILKTMFS